MASTALTYRNVLSNPVSLAKRGASLVWKFGIKPFVQLFMMYYTINRFFMYELPKRMTELFFRYFVFNWFLFPISRYILSYEKEPTPSQIQTGKGELVGKRRVSKAGQDSKVVSSLKQNVVDLQTQLKEQNQLVDQLKKERISLEQVIQDKNQQIIDIVNRKEVLERTLDFYKSPQSKKATNKLTREIHNASFQEETARVNEKQIDYLTELVNSLQKEKNRIEQDSIKQLQLMHEVDNMLTIQGNKLKEFEDAKQNIRNELDRVLRENEQLKIERDRLNFALNEKANVERELERKAETVKNLELGITDLTNQIRTLTEENSNLQLRNYALEKEKKERVQKEDAVDRLKEQFLEMQNRMNDREERIKNLNKMNQEKDARIKSLSEEVKNVRKHPEQGQEVHLLEQELKKVIKEKEDLYTELRQLKQRPGKKQKEELIQGMDQTLIIEEVSEKEEESYIKKEGVEPSVGKVEEEPYVKEEPKLKGQPSVVVAKEEKPSEKAAIPKEKQKAEKEQKEILNLIEPKEEKEEMNEILAGEESKPIVYDVKDNFVDELTEVLDDVERGEIENVQFQSVANLPQLKGSLCNVHPDQLRDMLEVLKTSEDVSFVDFSNTGLNTDLAKRILHALAANKSIETLDLGHNTFIEYDSVTDDLISFIQQNDKCQSLIIKDWSFSKENFHRIVESLEGNRALIELKINEKSMDEQDKITLRQTLGRNKK